MKNRLYFAQAIAGAILSLFLNVHTAHCQTKTCISPLNDTNYSKYEVIEGASYLQTNAGAPVLNGSNGFVFTGSINLRIGLSASNATLIVPGEAARNMFTSDHRVFSFVAVTNSFSNLTAAFPSGGYQYMTSISAPAVNLPANLTLPNAPTLNNFTAAQSINPAADFTLSWSPFVGGQTGDFIDVTVGGSVFQSPEYGCADGLNGTATSFVIPANTLGTNQSYRVNIQFIKILTVDTNSTPFVALLGGVESVTQLNISTGAAGAQLLFQNVAELPGGNLSFSLATVPNSTYEIDYSQFLGKSAQWTPLLTTNAAGTTVSLITTPPFSTTFYRAIQK